MKIEHDTSIVTIVNDHNSTFMVMVLAVIHYQDSPRLNDIINDIELKVAKGIIAVACRPKDGAAVQIALAELGSKAVQIPSGEGTPVSRISSTEKSI